jgi:predicted dinucleotide-binding enzyme
VVTIPLKNIGQVPVLPLAGKIVIDTNNYYPQRDGHIADLDNELATSAELLQRHLPASKVVKAFNHIQAAALTADAQASGTPNRRALAIAGNDDGAKAEVARLIGEFGFDVLDIGPLSESWRIQPHTPGYGHGAPPSTCVGILRERSDLPAPSRQSDRLQIGCRSLSDFLIATVLKPHDFWAAS